MPRNVVTFLHLGRPIVSSGQNTCRYAKLNKPTLYEFDIKITRCGIFPIRQHSTRDYKT